jgi:hypothetical protein
MNVKPWLSAPALLSICFLSAQQPAQQGQQQSNHPAFQQPSPEALRHFAELRQPMRDHAIAINDLADHIQSLEDANKLVNLVADEFSNELPPKWATQSIRSRIARAEFESAYDPGSLIPDQHVADAWDDFARKIGAPPETMLTAAEIHYLRDAQYVSARLAWVGYEKDIWTIPGVFALGSDGKIANGSRALEAIRLLWQLANNTGDFSAIHAEVQKGVLLSDRIPHPEQPPAPGQVQRSFGVVRMESVSNPVQQAALRYMHDHGDRAFNRAIEELLKNLFNG